LKGSARIATAIVIVMMIVIVIVTVIAMATIDLTVNPRNAATL